MKKKICGVYFILCTKTGDLFLNASEDVEKDILEFQIQMSQKHRGTSMHVRMNKIWRQFGAISFEYGLATTIESDPEDLDMHLEYLTDVYKPEITHLRLKSVCEPEERVQEPIRKVEIKHRGVESAILAFEKINELAEGLEFPDLPADENTTFAENPAGFYMHHKKTLVGFMKHNGYIPLTEEQKKEKEDKRREDRRLRKIEELKNLGDYKVDRTKSKIALSE